MPSGNNNLSSLKAGRGKTLSECYIKYLSLGILEPISKCMLFSVMRRDLMPIAAMLGTTLERKRYLSRTNGQWLSRGCIFSNKSQWIGCFRYGCLHACIATSFAINKHKQKSLLSAMTHAIAGTGFYSQDQSKIGRLVTTIESGWHQSEWSPVPGHDASWHIDFLVLSKVLGRWILT